jgi:hypothetical protein
MLQCFSVISFVMVSVAMLGVSMPLCYYYVSITFLAPRQSVEKHSPS